MLIKEILDAEAFGSGEINRPQERTDQKQPPAAKDHD
jgi:hypothetical protein